MSEHRPEAPETPQDQQCATPPVAESKDVQEIKPWVAALAVAGTLVVGAFAAVGVTGDSLAGVVRNNPLPTAAATSVVLASTAVAVWRRLSHAFEKFALVVLTLALAAIVWEGATSLDDRAIPEIAMSVPELGADGNMLIKIKIAGHGLTSNEKMLLQVVGVTEEFQSRARSYELCARSVYSLEADPERAQHVRLLVWNETGPDRSGGAATETELTLPEKSYRQVCVFAALWARHTRSGQPDAPSTWALWLPDGGQLSP